jgi:hypothetical protein
MKTTAKKLLLLTFLTLVPAFCDAQCTMNNASACSQGVPHFVKFSGTLKNLVGVPHSSVVAIRFVIYGDATGGTPLWQEVQNTPVDSQGRYEVALGVTASVGIPMELFTSGEPRWLGVQPLLPGVEEQPRVLMVSVPYALEAADAQTLGGLPASAFAKAASVAAGDATSGTSAAPITAAAPAAIGTPIIAEPNAVPSGTVTATGATRNTIPKFATGTSLVDSQIADQGGVVSVENLSNILFADRFSGGVPAAVAACPANGCIIYAVSPKVNLNLGNIDPGFKAITIYLGPYTYTVKQVTLRKGMKIIGMGASGGVNGSATCSIAAPCNGTALQSINGNNPVFVVPQAANSPVTNVALSGFRLLASVGNTSEDGFFLDASSNLNSGLWYSTFHDITVVGFAGIGLHLRARNSDFGSADQWLLFDNVTVLRAPGGGYGLSLEGSVFELRFRNCQFDGQGDGTNIYIGGFGGGTGGWPETIVFETLISQQAAVAVQIDGAINLTFYGSHIEADTNGFLITNKTNIGARGVTISDSYFAGNVGSNNGAGYDLNIGTTNAAGIVFVHNQIFGNPDAIVKGTNLASIVYEDNLYAGSSNVPPTSGITAQVAPASSINIQGVHSVGLNPSSTVITTIQSSLGPGEMVTFFTFAGPATFASGGNINLMGQNTVVVNGSITFVRNDLTGSLQWTPVAQWSAMPSSPTARNAIGEIPVRPGG